MHRITLVAATTVVYRLLGALGLAFASVNGYANPMFPAACFGQAPAEVSQHLLRLKIPRPVMLQVVGIHSDSATIARVLYLRDITRESEVGRLESEFMAHAAHELRTPMTSILAFSELLLSRQLDEAKRVHLVGNIHRQARPGQHLHGLAARGRGSGHAGARRSCAASRVDIGRILA